MTSKNDVGSSDNEKKETKKKSRRSTASTVNHALVARWIQEQIMNEVPEVGYLPEALIERVLRMSHRYYIQQGFASIKLANK